MIILECEALERVVEATEDQSSLVLFLVGSVDRVSSVEYNEDLDAYEISSIVSEGIATYFVEPNEPIFHINSTLQMGTFSATSP